MARSQEECWTKSGVADSVASVSVWKNIVSLSPKRRFRDQLVAGAVLVPPEVRVFVEMSKQEGKVS